MKKKDFNGIEHMMQTRDWVAEPEAMLSLVSAMTKCKQSRGDSYDGHQQFLGALEAVRVMPSLASFLPQAANVLEHTLQLHALNPII